MTVPSDRKEAETLRRHIEFSWSDRAEANAALDSLLAVVERYENALREVAGHPVDEECDDACTQLMVNRARAALAGSGEDT